MLSWIAIIIAAFALVRAWYIYSRDKMKRDFKLRYITKRLKEIDERDAKMKESTNDQT